MENLQPIEPDIIPNPDAIPPPTPVSIVNLHLRGAANCELEYIDEHGVWKYLDISGSDININSRTFKFPINISPKLEIDMTESDFDVVLENVHEDVENYLASLSKKTLKDFIDSYYDIGELLDIKGADSRDLISYIDMDDVRDDICL